MKEPTQATHKVFCFNRKISSITFNRIWFFQNDP